MTKGNSITLFNYQDISIFMIFKKYFDGEPLIFLIPINFKSDKTSKYINNLRKNVNL